jgi:hypothetical protein
MVTAYFVIGITVSMVTRLPIPVATRSNACVYGRSVAGIAGSNPDGAWMSECCELSDRGLCVRLITRPEESYRVWCVWVWSWSLDNEEALARWGLSSHWKTKWWADCWLIDREIGVPFPAWARDFSLHSVGTPNFLLVTTGVKQPECNTDCSFAFLRGKECMYLYLHSFHTSQWRST